LCQNKKAGIEAGMQDLLAKPLTASKVGDILKIYTQSGIDKSASVLVPPAIHNTTIIDRDALLSIWNSYPTFKAAFIDTRSDILSDINDFKTAYQKKDWEQFIYFTRKIRGSFLYFGASRVEEAFNHLEIYFNGLEGTTPDTTALASMYQMVVVEFDTTLKEIDRILSEIH
jgi:hypothetical protein